MARTHHIGRLYIGLPLLNLSGRASRVLTACFAVLVVAVVYLSTPRVALDSPLAYWAAVIGGLAVAVRARSLRAMWAGFAFAASAALIAWVTSTAVIHHVRYSELLGPECAHRRGL